jgi:hypothetical protein
VNAGRQVVGARGKKARRRRARFAKQLLTRKNFVMLLIILIVVVSLSDAEFLPRLALAGTLALALLPVLAVQAGAVQRAAPAECATAAAATVAAGRLLFDQAQEEISSRHRRQVVLQAAAPPRWRGISSRCVGEHAGEVGRQLQVALKVAAGRGATDLLADESSAAVR